jgi:ribosomal protein L11 methyltransferase
MLALFPEGFEEGERGDDMELAAYTDAGGEELLREQFPKVTSTSVEQDWEERWKRFHRSVRAGGVWIVPPWEEPKDGLSIVIDPGRAFGTGAHPTTRLVLELLTSVERGSLLDVGCGSGVLAIAGAKLGFAPVTAVDRAPQAVAAAAENAAANGVVLEIAQRDAVDDALPPADVAVMNISQPLVARIGPRIDCRLLITSGYFEPHVPRLPGFSRRDRAAAEGWAADLHVRE